MAAWLIRTVALTLGALSLVACTPLPVPAPSPVTIDTAPMPAPPPAGPRGPREVARDFVTVVERVEPVAERECRARSGGLNCDFRIVVDDRPGVPANAFQTEDEAGRPIIAVTLALLADTRNRDEIAFVLAHEASHHIAGHLERQRQNATLGAAVFGELAGALNKEGLDIELSPVDAAALAGLLSCTGAVRRCTVCCRACGCEAAVAVCDGGDDTTGSGLW